MQDTFERATASPGPRGSEPDRYTASYQGQPGAYSEQAAYGICGQGASLLPCATLADAFRAVAEGRAASAVVPIENTLAGAVPGALSLLLASGLLVHAETSQRIDHVIAGTPGAALDDVREVLSHPVALAQCERFFRAHPAIRAVSVFDTAGAVEMVSRHADPRHAAIASRAAARLYGASILAEHVQDHEANYTRFVHVAPGPRREVAGGPCRIMLAARLAHEPGTLVAALQVLNSLGLNLTRIDSSPVAGCPYEYEFFIEAVTALDSDASSTIEVLGRDSRFRLLGCYSTGV
jgi:prephenate dehydratase